MSRTRILTVLLALVALAALPSAASAADPHQWTVNNAGGPINAATDYQLANLTGGVIGYKDRTGVDLGWTTTGGNWQFQRGNPRDHRRITADEPLALYNTKTKKYLVNADQTFGIDLAWSGVPYYQWKVEQTGSRFSLYNLREHDYVNYGERTWGINLVWAGLKGAGDGLKTASVGLDRDGLVWTGYRAYKVDTPGDRLDTLIKLKNVSSDTLYFLTANSSGGAGGDPGDIELDPGRTLSADQMKRAFGSETPSMDRFFHAFIKEPTPVTRTYVSLTYVDR